MRIEAFAYDVRLAWRALRRARGFTAAAVLTLAVGMGATTSMFALIQGVLLRPLPLPAPDRLVTVWQELPATGQAPWPYRAAEVDAIREATPQLFSGVAASGYNDPSRLDAIEGGAADELHVARVSGNFFDVLGARPFLGRALAPADDAAGAEPVIVLTYGLWQRRYGGARNVIGRRLTIGEQRFTVVGVMPPDIEFPRGAGAWMTVEASATIARNPTFAWAVRNELLIVARLRPGVTLAQASSGLAAIDALVEAAAPEPSQGPGARPTVRSFSEVVIGDVRGGLLVLFAAVALVLLIASANVANLLLVRGEGRRPEMVVRAALGARRSRLVGQVVAESLLLTLMGGAIGIAATWGSLQALIALVPGGLPRISAVRIDLGVVLFVLVLSVLTTVLAGLVPALETGRITLAPRMPGRRMSGRVASRARQVLVAGQVALALAVVVATGLVSRSVLRLESTGADLGADRLLFVSLALPQARYADRERLAAFLTELVARLDATAAVEAATPINAVPFSGVGWDVPVFTAEGQSVSEARANGSLNLEAIQPGYFETFGVRLVRGRSFASTDRRDAPPVVIVSEDVANRLWPGEDPLGRRLKMGSLDVPDPWRTIVGVAARTRYRELRTSHPTLYVPAEQLIVTAQSLVVRATAPPAAAAGAIREQVRAADPEVRVVRVAPFSDLLREPLARPRFYAVLLGLFGGSALLLAAVGLFGVIAASVRHRYTEIGVRLAVGASPSDVRRLIVLEGVRLAAIGAAAGLALATAVTRFLAGLLYEVHPLDPATLGGATLLLLAAGVLASYLPGRTAARLDPAAALRAE